jgi:hypothetical protein
MILTNFMGIPNCKNVLAQNSSKHRTQTFFLFIQKEKNIQTKGGTRLAIIWEGGILELSLSKSKRAKTALLLLTPPPSIVSMDKSIRARLAFP